MGYTMTEKILMRKTHRPVKRGEIILIPADVTMTHETGTTGMLHALQDIPFEKPHEGLEMCIMSDHFIPAQTVGHAENQKTTREFAKKWNVKNYYEIGRAGICHQTMPEKGHIRPGEIVVGTDSHVTTYGALGCMGIGVGVTDMAMLVASGQIWLRVPKVLKLNLTGELPAGVSGKDLAIEILCSVDLAHLNYWIVEVTGPGVHELSIDSRLCLCNMLAEGGIKTCMVGCDQQTDAFLKAHTRKAYELVSPDVDAIYDYEVDFDLSTLTPMVACPHHPTNGVPVSQLPGDIKIDQAFVGSCTNGRMEDLRAVAAVLRGKKVAPHVRMIITPATQAIWKQAMDEGLLDIFVDADALVTNPTCGTCIGAHGLLARGEVCISSGNRNLPGRMGSVESSVYLASPATVAASAVAGVICGAD